MCRIDKESNVISEAKDSILRELVIIATDTARRIDGYTTRILMEIEKLKKYYDISLLIQGTGEITANYDSGIKIINYPTSKVQIRGLTYFLNLREFEKVFKKNVKKGKSTIVYAESLFPALIANRVAKKNENTFVYDCHGTQPDEYKLYHRGRINAFIAKVLEHEELKIVKGSNLVVTVTNNQWRKWNTTGNHVVLPMTPSTIFFDPNNYREEIRRELGIGENELVFVYSGRNQKWQMSEGTISVYKKISERISNTRLLILTPECDVFASIIEKKEIKNAIIKSVKYEDMPKYLDACDYGFCLRSSSIINIVASPTKVLEYLARNVKPILTEYVGEFSSALKEAHLAEIIDIDNPVISFDDGRQTNNCGKEYAADFVENVWNRYITALKKL